MPDEESYQRQYAQGIDRYNVYMERLANKVRASLTICAYCGQQTVKGTCNHCGGPNL